MSPAFCFFYRHFIWLRRTTLTHGEYGTPPQRCAFSAANANGPSKATKFQALLGCDEGADHFRWEKSETNSKLIQGKLHNSECVSSFWQLTALLMFWASMSPSAFWTFLRFLPLQPRNYIAKVGETLGNSTTQEPKVQDRSKLPQVWSEWPSPFSDRISTQTPYLRTLLALKDLWSNQMAPVDSTWTIPVRHSGGIIFRLGCSLLSATAATALSSPKVGISINLVYSSYTFAMQHDPTMAKAKKNVKTKKHHHCCISLCIPDLWDLDRMSYNHFKRNMAHIAKETRLRGSHSPTSMIHTKPPSSAKVRSLHAS